ncbi:MAG: anthranilate phosphoribosyltransferase [Chthoniobacteraceae bacterium]
MDTLTRSLRSGNDLAPGQIREAVAALISEKILGDEKKDFLKALRAKDETAREIAGFAEALLEHAVDPQIDPASLPGPMLDVCGTGGDQRGYFNVSTAVMFVAAAAGACVVKHGNRSITSKTGAADVLEELGVKLELDPARLRECVARNGVAFVFAPAWHPAFKAIGPVRRELAAEGIPTIFNLLGPLLNPARPAHQLVGLFNSALLPKYAEALRILGRRCAWAVHGDGTDELSLTGTSEVRAVNGADITAFLIASEDIGLQRCEPTALVGGERMENARILLAILDGTERGPMRDMVLLNSAAALMVAGLASDLNAGVDTARRAIESGAALAKLRALQSFA